MGIQVYHGATNLFSNILLTIDGRPTIEKLVSEYCAFKAIKTVL